MGVDAVANDLRPYENDELGPHQAIGALGEGAAEQAWQLIKQRKAAAAALLPLADQARQQDGLAARDRDRALDLALRDRRGQRVGARRRRYIADLLLDVEADVAIDVDARDHPQNDSGVAIVDGVDDGVLTRQHVRAAGGDRHVVADLERRRLIIDDDDGRIRQYLDAGDGVQRIQNEARLLLWPDQKVEPRKGPDKKCTGDAFVIQKRWLGSAGTEHRAAVGLEAEILAGQEELHAIVQIVVQRHLGDGGLDCDLHLRSIDLTNGALDDPVVLLARIDQQRV